MNIFNTLTQQKTYIINNNYKKQCGINLYCCQLNFYKNTEYYLQQFICFLYKY